jgi:hypothetical protein
LRVVEFPGEGFQRELEAERIGLPPGPRVDVAYSYGASRNGGYRSVTRMSA